jgi:hypothetical protein
MRANIMKAEIELKACFPNGTWFGFGLGGYLMTNTELVFLMAPRNTQHHRVVSTRMTGAKKSTRPANIPSDSPIYKRTIESCGEGRILFSVSRPLDTTGYTDS